jgi:DNA anti-recombination protein RmuC
MSDGEMRSLYEKFGALEQKINAAHTRQDKMETEIKELLKELSNEMKEVMAFVNQSKGSKAAWATIGALSVALLGALAKLFIH